jgi:hypothetical protein
MRVLLFSLALLAPFAMAAPAAVEPGPAPAAIPFDGDAYAFAARETDPARIAEHYLRADETIERFSRRLTVADQPQATSAKAVALGVIKFAKQRTDGIAPETFVAEGTQEKDISVAWYDLLDDGSAVDYHAARFVDLASGGVREYHYTVRQYTNGQRPDTALGALRGTTERHTLRWVEMLTALDRVPVHPLLPPPTKKKH